MSLIPIPVCFCCEKEARLSISCSNCCKICCGTCFGLESNGDCTEEQLLSLVDQRCMKCKSCPVETAQPVVNVKQERCWLHGKELKLFCLSCEERICEDCFLSGAAHMRHQIDFVVAVYEEKRAETEQKLALLEETVKDLQYDVVQSEKNLEIVQGAERSILEDIDEVCVEAKLSVARLTSSRKRTLQIRTELPHKKQKLNEALLEMVEKLPPDEFFKQQPLVNQQCEEIISSCDPNTFTPVKFEDIGCDLVPPYEMHRFTLTSFDKIIYGWPFHMVKACDVSWNILLRKQHSLYVKVMPHDELVAQYPYKALVIVPHQDLRKTVQKTFMVHGETKEVEITTSQFLMKEGFISKSNELVVQVGIRPLNAVSENRFLKQQQQVLKNKIAEMEKQLLTSDKDVNCKFYIMQYNLNLSNTPKKNQEAHHSAYILDRFDRNWCLRVYPFQSAVPDANLKVFVVLRKGTYTRARYFIELMHDDPKKNVLQTTESKFDTLDAGYGWHCFVERKRLLSDAGYYPNGILRFRFGVHPLDG